ncbi:hypothetical protein QU38_00230, partial [Staphylococcus aureus]
MVEHPGAAHQPEAPAELRDVEDVALDEADAPYAKRAGHARAIGQAGGAEIERGYGQRRVHPRQVDRFEPGAASGNQHFQRPGLRRAQRGEMPRNRDMRAGRRRAPAGIGIRFILGAH